MLKFSANISTLYTEVPFLERFEMAREGGFAGIEFQFPYEHKPEDIEEALARTGLALILFNFPAGDFISGGPGNAAVPGREDEFADALEIAFEYAEILKPGFMNILSGRPDSSLDPEQCMSVLCANMVKAIDRFSALETCIVTEAINTFDMPDFFLSNSTQVIDLINKLKPGQLRLQFDIYHMQRMEGDLENRLREIISYIGHIQFADAPGRHEPGTGEIDFESLFAVIEDLPYKGYVGAEYFPSEDTTSSLGWYRANTLDQKLAL